MTSSVFLSVTSPSPFSSLNLGFTLDSNEHYFRARNRALPQHSHFLLGSTRDLWIAFKYTDVTPPIKSTATNSAPAQ
jgi:hypothetical protein